MTAPAVWSATTGLDDGRHIVLIHGSLDRSAGMLKLSRRLDHEFRVTRYEDPGRMVSASALSELAVTPTRIVVPITETSGSIWVLDGLKR